MSKLSLELLAALRAMCSESVHALDGLNLTVEKGEFVAIVLADEPTGNLDSKTSQDVMGLLKVTGQRFGQIVTRR